MRLDGFGIFVKDMTKMIQFYRDVLGFEIKESEDTANVYLIIKDETLFMLYGRKDFEKMTSRKYEYIMGLNGHFEIALYVDTYDEVDKTFAKVVSNGAKACNRALGTAHLLYSRPRRKLNRNRLMEQAISQLNG